MADDGPWLNVPQAVVLEATRDIDLALDLTAESAALLLIKASWRVARRPVIPPEADADTRQPGDVLRAVHEAKTALPRDSHYLEAQRRVHGRLVEGVKTKARRTPRGPYESLDPVEYIGAELEGMDAIDKKTGTVILFDLLINLIDYVETLTGQPIRPVGAASSRAPDQMQEQSSQDFQKWECTGDPVPKLIDWARSRWGEGSQALPNRFELLEVFRGQFGRVLGINEKTMREVRRRLASREARRGGAATHRR
jgi:hypothetical protein